MHNAKWKNLHRGIAEYFKPRTLPVAFKYYDNAEEMLSHSGLTLSKMLCTPCLAVARAVYAGECVCITSDNLNTDYCRGVNNLREKDEKSFTRARSDVGLRNAAVAMLAITYGKCF